MTALIFSSISDVDIIPSTISDRTKVVEYFLKWNVLASYISFKNDINSSF